MTWTNVKTWELSTSFLNRPAEWDLIWVELFEEWLPSLGHKTSFIRREYVTAYGQTLVEYAWTAYNTDAKDLTPAPNELFVRWFPDGGSVVSNAGLLYVYRVWFTSPYEYFQNDTRLNTPNHSLQFRNADFMPVRLWLSDQKAGSFMLTWQGRIMLAWFDSVAWVFTDTRYPATGEVEGGYLNRSLHMPLVKFSWGMANAPSIGVTRQNAFVTFIHHTFGDQMVSDNAFMEIPVSLGSSALPNHTSLNTDDVSLLSQESTYRLSNTYSVGNLTSYSLDDAFFHRVLVNNAEWWLVYSYLGVWRGNNFPPSLAFKCSEELPPAP